MMKALTVSGIARHCVTCVTGIGGFGRVADEVPLLGEKSD